MNQINKSGYYLTDNGNLVIVYPKISEVTLVEGYNVHQGWFHLFFTKDLLEMTNKTTEYYYLGEL